MSLSNLNSLQTAIAELKHIINIAHGENHEMAAPLAQLELLAATIQEKAVLLLSSKIPDSASSSTPALAPVLTQAFSPFVCQIGAPSQSATLVDP